MTLRQAQTLASFNPTSEGFAYGFWAMGCPCQVLLDTPEPMLARWLGALVEAEALRIEAKYSRYRDDSVVARINSANGAPVMLDHETAALIEYAAHCHDLSNGRFDITSGVLRQAWRFDGSDRIPSRREVRALLHRVGWEKAVWRRPELTLPAGMEIDLGGLGKEYAVDSAMAHLQAASKAPALINFGGDLRVTGPRANGEGWRVAIASIEQSEKPEGFLHLSRGALTTSGDAQRYLLKDGVRYGHILDPRTGWPVKDPPRSVTVAADTCIQAGVLSTFAMLRGGDAERFLADEGVQAWCVR